MTTAWYWPPSGLTARGVACVPYGAGLAVPDWTTPRYFPFTPGVGFGGPVVLGALTPGISSAAADSSGGAWFVAYGDSYWHLSSGGTVLTTGNLPSGQVWIGAAVAGVSGFAMSSSGTVDRMGPTAAVGSWSGSTLAFAASGSAAVAALMPSGSLLVTMTSGGVTGSIGLPTAIGIPSCLAVASGGVPAVAGGWQVAPSLSGMIAAALDPQSALTMLAVGSGRALLWSTSGAVSENWFQSQVLSGLANLNAVAWRPDGSQALGTSVVSGDVQVIAYTAGVLSLAQTLAVSGACSVAVAGSSVNAIVAQSGQTQIATLSYGGVTWVTGSPVTGVTGVTAVAMTSNSSAAATYSGGVALLSLTAGTWSMAAYVPLGFAPSVLAVDAFSRLFAAGSGALAIVSGGTVLGSGTWSGSTPTSMVVHEGRVVMTIPSDGLFRVFAESSPGAWTQEGSGSLSLGAQVGLALSDTVLFAMGSGATNTYGFSGTPFVLTPVTSGALSQWNGSTWTTTALGIGHNPSAVAFDASGNAWTVTVQDTYFSVSSGGTVLSSGIVPVFDGQQQTAPMGASTINPIGGNPFVNYSGTWDIATVVSPLTLSAGNTIANVSGAGTVRGAVRSTPAQAISELTLFTFDPIAAPPGSLQLNGICNATFNVFSNNPGTDAGGNSIGFPVPGSGALSGAILLKNAPLGYATPVAQGDTVKLAVDASLNLWLSADDGVTWNGGIGTGGSPFTSTGGYPATGLAAGPYYAITSITSTSGTLTSLELLSSPNAAFQVFVTTSLAGVLVEIA